MHFLRGFERNEIQKVSARIWSWIIKSIFHEAEHMHHYAHTTKNTTTTTTTTTNNNNNNNNINKKHPHHHQQKTLSTIATTQR